MQYYQKVSDLLGKTLVSVEQTGDEQITFILEDGSEYLMSHHQDCCESVNIEDVNGNLHDLVGSPLTQAEENTKEQEDGHYGDSQTWTFYKFATLKGYVTIRWHGSSNGYYSESVDFDLVHGPTLAQSA